MQRLSYFGPEQLSNCKQQSTPNEGYVPSLMPMLLHKETTVPPLQTRRCKI